MKPNAQIGYERIYMCYLDEKYADQKAPRNLQVTSLTGVYMPVDKVVDFRRRLYSLITEIFLYDVQSTNIPSSVPCHASELFRGAVKSNGVEVTDKDRMDFLRGLITIVNQMELDVVRLGYRRNCGLEELGKSLEKDYATFEKILLWGLIFSGFLPQRSLSNESSQLSFFENASDSAVYYCMENDNSPLQQRMFHSSTSFNMWLREFVGDSMTVDFDQVGDVLSYSKGDALGVLPDCLGYILHQGWLEGQGFGLTAFKSEMASLCSTINSDLVSENIVDKVETG